MLEKDPTTNLLIGLVHYIRFKLKSLCISHILKPFMSSTSAKPVTVTVKRFWHIHPLKIFKRGVIFSNCLKCGEPLNKSCYFCDPCNRGWHVECIPGSQDIDHPCHPNHPLELVVHGEEPHDTAQWKCTLCEKPFNEYMYHCQICDFSVDQSCITNPPPYIIHRPSCHMEHAVTLMTTPNSFVCHACGTQGEGTSYVCHPCSLRFHTDCVQLPYVININCHDHPVFHAYFLVGGGCKCGICLQEVNWRYGAYFCHKCPSFAVHYICATTTPGMWDGLELPGMPKGAETLPYKVIEDGVINHFSHKEHNLRLVTSFSIRSCEACVRSIHSNKHYKCVECDYSLHVACANLSLQVWNGLSRRPFTLLSNKGTSSSYLFCDACQRVSNGFRYKGDGITFDTQCASALRSRYFISHPHALYLATLEPHTCGVCNIAGDLVLRCEECNFSLDFKCATLPEMIRHKCDHKHFLSLQRGEVASGKYWCEICETTLNPNIRFYTCHDCGIVCHVECVLGDFVNLRPGLLNVSDKGRKVSPAIAYHSFIQAINSSDVKSPSYGPFLEFSVFCSTKRSSALCSFSHFKLSLLP